MSLLPCHKIDRIGLTTPTLQRRSSSRYIAEDGKSSRYHARKHNGLKWREPIGKGRRALDTLPWESRVRPGRDWTSAKCGNFRRNMLLRSRLWSEGISCLWSFVQTVSEQKDIMQQSDLGTAYDSNTEKREQSQWKLHKSVKSGRCST